MVVTIFLLMVNNSQYMVHDTEVFRNTLPIIRKPRCFLPWYWVSEGVLTSRSFYNFSTLKLGLYDLYAKCIKTNCLGFRTKSKNTYSVVCILQYVWNYLMQLEEYPKVFCFIAFACPMEFPRDKCRVWFSHEYVDDSFGVLSIFVFPP